MCLEGFFWGGVSENFCFWWWEGWFGEMVYFIFFIVGFWIFFYYFVLSIVFVSGVVVLVSFCGFLRGFFLSLGRFYLLENGVFKF